METFLIYRDSLLEDFPTVVNSALKSIKNFIETFWISDMLHLLKLARKWLIHNTICLYYGSLEHSFAVWHIKPILHLWKALSDTSSTGKMRDSYTKQIFTMKNLMKLINEGESEATAYFLPYCS